MHTLKASANTHEINLNFTGIRGLKYMLVLKFSNLIAAAFHNVPMQKKFFFVHNSTN